MSKVKIEGHGTGTGTFTVTTPSSNTDRTITLPDETATLSTFNPDGAVTINESGADVDFRVESDTNTHALFVQGSDGNVGIGTATPTQQFESYSTSTHRLRVSNANYGIDLVQLAGGSSPIINAYGTDTSLIFHINDSEKMRIKSTGKVGIGTTNLVHILNLASTSSSASIRYQNDAQFFDAGIKDDSGTDKYVIHAGQSGSDELKLSSGGALYIRGSLTQNSDERLKTNIQTITSALSKVIQMRGVSYDRIDNDESTVGLIAQELELIAPELVQTDSSEEKLKSVAYSNLGAYLIEAVKELSAKNDALEARILELENA